MKIKKKRPGLAHLKKWKCRNLIIFFLSLGDVMAASKICLKRKTEPSMSSSKFDENLSSNEDSEDPNKKKVRTTFTGRQIFELEKMFENKKYLSSSERADMAKLLNVTEQQVRLRKASSVLHTKNFLKSHKTRYGRGEWQIFILKHSFILIF